VPHLSEVRKVMVAMAKATTFTQKLAANRLWVQTAFLLVWLDPLALRMHNICGAVFHCYACPLALFACPIGIMANFSSLHMFPFMAVGTLVVVGAVFGGFVCGFACPFGLLQDMAAKIPVRKYRMPAWFGYGRYFVLIVLVLLVPFLFGENHWLSFCRICPAGALEGAVPYMVSQAAAGQAVTIPNPLKITVLVSVLVGMVLVYRFWCRLCPLGAIFGLFNKVSFFFLRVNPSACTHCQICHTNCQIGDAPEEKPNSGACVRCMGCTECRPGAITVGSVVDSPQDKQAQA
jgi:ferredoxin-type protein NapH